MKKIHRIILLNIVVLIGLVFFIGHNFDNAFYTTSVLEGKVLTMKLYREEYGHIFKLIVSLLFISLSGLIGYSAYTMHNSHNYYRAGNSYSLEQVSNSKSYLRIFEYICLAFVTFNSLIQTFKAFTLPDTALGHKVIESDFILSYYSGVIVFLIIIALIEYKENKA